MCCLFWCVHSISNLPFSVWFHPKKTQSSFAVSVNCLFLAAHLHWPNQRQFPWHLHTNPKESFTYMNKTVKHSNEHTFVGLDENLYEVKLFLDLFRMRIHVLLFFCLDYSKRVYQGVRVKHTVKDLLAEKRSRQTNGPRYSVSTSSSKPSCLCPILSLPTSFFSQTKQCSHSWHSVGGIIERSPFEKKNLLPLFTF